jgi:hypothetical protein
MISNMRLVFFSPCVPTRRKPLDQVKVVDSFGAQEVGSFGVHHQADDFFIFA